MSDETHGGQSQGGRPSRRFGTALRGYNQEQVDRYLRRINAKVDAYARNNKELEEALERANQRLERANEQLQRAARAVERAQKLEDEYHDRIRVIELIIAGVARHAPDLATEPTDADADGEQAADEDRTVASLVQTQASTESPARDEAAAFEEAFTEVETEPVPELEAEPEAGGEEDGFDAGAEEAEKEAAAASTEDAAGDEETESGEDSAFEEEAEVEPSDALTASQPGQEVAAEQLQEPELPSVVELEDLDALFETDIAAERERTRETVQGEEAEQPPAAQAGPWEAASGEPAPDEGETEEAESGESADVLLLDLDAFAEPAPSVPGSAEPAPGAEETSMWMREPDSFGDVGDDLPRGEHATPPRPRLEIVSDPDELDRILGFAETEEGDEEDENLEEPEPAAVRTQVADPTSDQPDLEDTSIEVEHDGVPEDESFGSADDTAEIPMVRREPDRGPDENVHELRADPRRGE